MVTKVLHYSIWPKDTAIGISSLKENVFRGTRYANSTSPVCKSNPYPRASGYPCPTQEERAKASTAIIAAKPKTRLNTFMPPAGNKRPSARSRFGAMETLGRNVGKRIGGPPADRSLPTRLRKWRRKRS